MNLKDSNVGGVAGLVPSWVSKYRQKLLRTLTEGVQDYITKHTDPYVLDNASKDLAVAFDIDDSIIGLSQAYSNVPCMQKMKDACTTDRDGRLYKFFPLELFEEQYKTCANLLVRLIQCNNTYISAGQKVKKLIFQQLFSNDTDELNELLEDEL
jgi:hypothetical protein